MATLRPWRHRKYGHATKQSNQGGLDQVAFTAKKTRRVENDANTDSGQERKDKGYIKCFNCKNYGHYRSECRDIQRKAFDISAQGAVHKFAEMAKGVDDYVGGEYTHGGDMDNFEDFHCQRPEDLVENANRYEVELYWKRRGIYQENKMSTNSMTAP